MDRTRRMELEKCDKGAPGVVGKRKAKRKHWTGDMPWLQGEDSSFISKLFFKDPEYWYGPAPGVEPITSPSSFPV